jgi:hypothetical protein
VSNLPVAWLRRMHLGAMVAWMLLLVPTLIWWRQSLVYVVFMSWYAILVGHWASWQGARSEEASG